MDNTNVQFVLITTVGREATGVEWWMEQNDKTESVRFFDSFEAAKLEMRKTVKKLVSTCEFFPFENKRYTPLEDFIEDVDGDEELELLSNILRKTVTDPQYTYTNPEKLAIQDTDDGDWYFAFVGNKDLLLVQNGDTTLSCNIHVMNDSAKHYYFSFSETDEEGRIINCISVQLLNNGKKKKTSRKIPSLKRDYETVVFGKYMQSADDDTQTDLVWRVLEKEDNHALIVTESIIDHLRFSDNPTTDWQRSSLRIWLNSDFLSRAFNADEQSRIMKGANGDKVFLLETAECTQYFKNRNDARAAYTDYSRKKASKHYGTTIREQCGFWWVATPNGFEYLWHVCDNGQLNGFARPDNYDGVRPAMWIKLK